MKKRIDDFGNVLNDGDTVYAYIKGHYGQRCKVVNGEIAFTPIMKSTPSFMIPEIKKIK